ncbi:TPA: hypothetical protein DCL30_02645 [Candidatus Peribacteria bacterium]|nr:MAG: hypothetical protein A3J91_05475 [Candidatus Peribacteria bacterium RIFOXYC2_FULL_58_10]OGJ84317.1 MAG: hypothetical protein A2529_03040 [Candidatus Peribacteria bacterium RIFOXYD2_FULL_58_15]HAI98420.1 hypothetical protein [Candidatus Peribacteria bacterium]HAS34006.1 hypothetical protein [Candidatus Peribacteria bacterium]
MPLKPPRRLPRQFNRPVTARTQMLLQRHRGTNTAWSDRWKRVTRRGQHLFKDIRYSLLKWVLVAVVACATLLVGLMTFSPIVEVREVTVTRVSTRLDIEQVQHALAPVFGQRLLFLSDRTVEQMVRSAVPDIQDVKVEKEYPSRLAVMITLQPLVARLKIQSPEESAASQAGSGSTTDFLTTQGIYVVAPLADEGADLPLITLVDWGVRPIPGSQPLSPEFLARMQQTEQALSEQFGYRVVRRIAYQRAQEFHLRIGEKTELWFDTVGPLEEQLKRLRSFLQNVDMKTVKQYVDLRMSDRVVFQ